MHNRLPGSAQGHRLRAARHTVVVVGDGQRAGARAGGRRLEGDVNGAETADSGAAGTGVGRGEIPAGGDAGDGQRGLARVGQPDGLGAATGSDILS